MADSELACAKRQPAPSDGELLELLRESAEEVFATMVAGYVAASRTVVLAPPDTRTSCPIGEYLLGTMVEFEGAINGAVVLRCDAVGAHNLAAGLLQLSDGATLELAELEDALSECANMITGLLKTKALDPRGRYRLGTPHKPDVAERYRGGALGTLVIRLSHGAVSLEIWRSVGTPED